MLVSLFGLHLIQTILRIGTPRFWHFRVNPGVPSTQCWNRKLNKPKEYPQQPETKTAAKHAMSEVCLLPRPSYSRGRAYKAQSQHKHFMKNRFSKSVRNTVAKIPEARAKVFFPKNFCPPHSSLHLPNIHHPHLLCPLHHLHLLYRLLHHLL